MVDLDRSLLADDEPSRSKIVPRASRRESLDRFDYVSLVILPFVELVGDHIDSHMISFVACSCVLTYGSHAACLARKRPRAPLWLPPPCFQKSPASILPTPNDRRDRFPTARASQDSLVSSRRTNSRTGQILHSCIIDGDSPLKFQTVPLFQTR